MATHQIAQSLAQMGRNGDSMLMHVQPREVAGLQALAKTQGTSLTINPETGLPEAFSLGGFFESLAPTLVGGLVSMIPGMQPFGLTALQSGILAGAATGALTNKKNPLLGAALGGMGGYGGANLASAASNFGTQAAKAGIDPSIAVIQTPGGIPSAATVAENTIGFQNAANLNAGLPIGGSSGAQAGIVSQAGNTAGTLGDNLSQAYSNVAADPMRFLSENKMAVGMPLAGATLGGLEPSDLGYNTLKPDGRDKYDPYASLNLSGDTGLRLYAQGGPVSFADGGDALKGGGTEAMQGSGLLPLDVSDINAKYGYSPAEWDSTARPGMAFGRDQGSFGGLHSMINQAAFNAPEVPKLGLFASNDQIEAARTAYEQQLAAAMSGRGGMGSVPNVRQLGSAGMGTQSGGPMSRVTTGIGGLSNTASTAPTASTAETALSRLNLNKQYANGGTVQTGGLQDLYATSDNPTMNPPLSRDGYGLGRLQAMADGGVAGYKAGGYLDGPGDGMSDSIPATIEGKQPARLADGEFVVPADVVSHLGNGSTKAGSQRLYGMLDKVRKARTGTTKQGKKINPAKYMPA